MNSSTPTRKRSFGSRLLWIFRTTFVTLLLIAILGGAAWGVFLGITELRRSADDINARIDANKERIAVLGGEIDQAREEDLGGQLHDLQNNLDDANGRLADLQAQLSDTLAALQDEIVVVADSSETAVADTAALGDALVTLQNDINESNGRIDGLGGEIDSIRAEAEQLDENLTQFTDAAISDTELDAIQQTVALFQIWEQVARARLYLAEDNVGLATADVERALRMIDVMLAASDDADDVEALELVQTRLALAFNSLPDDVETAVRDLENSWGQLDVILTDRLFPDAALIEAATAATATEETAAEETTTEETTAETETASPTPTPATVPTAAPTPTATPSS